MLKIKDNRDLKELKKFGFEECENSYKKWEEDDWVSEAVYVSKNDKSVWILLEGEYYNCLCGNNVLDFIFDLIQAGLVEKVVE